MRRGRPLKSGSYVVCAGEPLAVVKASNRKSLFDAEAFEMSIGGAEANVAVNLASKGYPVKYVTRVGADVIGKRLLRSLSELGVDVADTGWSVTGSPTGLYLKDSSAAGSAMLYYRAGSAASEMTVEGAPWELLTRARIAHVTGITAALSDSCMALTHELLDVRRNRATSFDVNYRPKLWPNRDAASELLKLAGMSSIVFVGLDEAQTLWGADSWDDVRKVLPGVKHLIVKDGPVAAIEFGPEKTTVVETPASTIVVESIGAGDAFAAGYIDGLLRGDPAELRLRRGHNEAARALATSEDFVGRKAAAAVHLPSPSIAIGHERHD